VTIVAKPGTGHEHDRVCQNEAGGDELQCRAGDVQAGLDRRGTDGDEGIRHRRHGLHGQQDDQFGPLSGTR
jgi:hypothetical protein